MADWLPIGQAHALMFASYERVTPHLKGYDDKTRDLTGMRQLYERAAIPIDAAPTVTVTGSKGKGSTAIMTAACLQAAGHRVGLMTSPHFRDLRERIRVNMRVIPAGAYQRIVTQLAPHIEAVDSTLPAGKYLSPTGLFLAVALRYFSEEGVSAIVLEVGRGGRYDDVSIVHNDVSVFTPIMEEHLDKLGPTIDDVAQHKAGIIKLRNTVISAPQTPDVRAIIGQVAAARQATIRTLDDAFHVGNVEYTGDTQRVSILDEVGHKAFILSNIGHFQANNLALAYQAAVALSPNVRNIPDHSPHLRHLRLVGRADRITNAAPRVFVDGAINRESAYLFKASTLHLQRGYCTLVTALPHDKDHEGLLSELLPHVDAAIVTQVSAGHLTFSDDVLAYARRIKPNTIMQPDVKRAFRHALEISETIWVVGTQSLVRDALTFWDIDLETLYTQDV